MIAESRPCRIHIFIVFRIFVAKPTPITSAHLICTLDSCNSLVIFSRLTKFYVMMPKSIVDSLKGYNNNATEERKMTTELNWRKLGTNSCYSTCGGPLIAEGGSVVGRLLNLKGSTSYMSIGVIRRASNQGFYVRRTGGGWCW